MPRSSLLGLVLLLACKPAGPVQSEWTPNPPPEHEAPTTPQADPADPATLAQMHALLGATEILRDRASRGETASLKEEAQALAASLQPDTSRPERWQGPLDVVRAQALAIAEDGDDTTAADALARIAHTCGDCHESASAQAAVSATIRRGPAPDVGKTEAEAMVIHRWATGQMWDSLVIPDGDRWIEGTTMFVLLPACSDRPDIHPDQAQRCKQAQNIARRAHVTDDRDARTALMGELLATCAPCHRAANAP